jgi:hypothetical protein
LVHHFHSFFPTNATFGTLYGVGAGVKLRTLQTTADESVEVFVFAGLAGSPKQLVVYPRGAADGTVSVRHRSDSPK